jgi:hypothetical protein
MVKSKNYNGNKIICEYDSSNLKGAEYDTITKKLKVTFGNDMMYEYDDVSHETFAELNLSESQGKYFNQKIAKNFTYRKI